MEWDKALAELLLREPEIRSWLALDPSPRALTVPRQAESLRPGGVERPTKPAVRVARPAIAS